MQCGQNYIWWVLLIKLLPNLVMLISYKYHSLLKLISCTQHRTSALSPYREAPEAVSGSLLSSLVPHFLVYHRYIIRNSNKCVHIQTKFWDIDVFTVIPISSHCFMFMHGNYICLPLSHLYFLLNLCVYLWYLVLFNL